MATMEQIRALVQRCESQEQIMKGLKWADSKVKGWDSYYQELVGCWFLLRAYKIDGKEDADGRRISD